MLHPDFFDMLETLCAHEVEFLVVGAHAMAAHGLVRATGDIDIWVRPTRENARKVLESLHDFGALLHDLTLEDLSTEGTDFQIGVEPVRIDILTAVSGLTFSNAWENRQPVELGNLEVFVVGRNDLLVSKRAAGRPKDIGDAAWLEEETDTEQ